MGVHFIYKPEDEALGEERKKGSPLSSPQNRGTPDGKKKTMSTLDDCPGYPRIFSILPGTLIAGRPSRVHARVHAFVRAHTPVSMVPISLSPPVFTFYLDYLSFTAPQNHLSGQIHGLISISL